MKKAVKKLARVFAIIISVCLILVAVLRVWDYIATRFEQKKYPPMGVMVKPFDSKIHVFSAGEKKEGEPTIVLISGAGTPSPTVDFNPMWSRLEKDHHVVVLDRPGYGWSESTKRARTVQNIVEEDREALKLAGFSPPYVLGAHSMGGFEANLFASTYPDEVAGVVMIDAMAPTIFLDIPTHSHGLISTIISNVYPLIRPTGLLRLLGSVSPDYIVDSSEGFRNNFKFVDPTLKNIDTVHVLQNYMNDMTAKESALLNSNAKTVNDKGFPSNIPLKSIFSMKPNSQPEYEKMFELQQKWVKQSEKGELIQIEGEHYIYHYFPDEVCKVITDLLDELKK